MEINLNEIRLTPLLDTVNRKKISDEIYFSKEYAGYISNSKLKLINPDQGGSPLIYKEGFTGYTNSSLSIGSGVHELFLQPETFIMGPDLHKPTAKLGLVIDSIRKYRTNGKNIYDSIIESCKKIHYYENSINNFRIQSIIKEGLEYYWKSKEIEEDIIMLPTKERDTVIDCVRNLNNSSKILNLVYPEEPIISYNEDAFFIDIKAIYKDKSCILKLKMKADNWTIDPVNKIITLNDLKTTSHFVQNFMKSSFISFHYSRQFGMYLWILLQYCKKKYNYNSKDWTIKCNVIVVETVGKHKTSVFNIDRNILEEGRKEFCKLLKMTAYCEIYGYSDDIIFTLC